MSGNSGLVILGSEYLLVVLARKGYLRDNYSSEYLLVSEWFSVFWFDNFLKIGVSYGADFQPLKGV